MFPPQYTKDAATGELKDRLLRLIRTVAKGEFVEAAKGSGLIKRAINRAGQVGYRVAPPIKRRR